MMTLKKNTVKPVYGSKPNRLLHFLLCCYSWLFLKSKYRIKFHNTSIKQMKAPFIVLGNHPSALDPFIIAAATYPHRINFLGTNYYFRNPLLRPFLRLGGVIPKVQAYKDTSAVRMMNKVIARGGILAICPEGRRSTDGSRYVISPSIGKLIKLYKVPVVTVVSHGAYMSKPRWSAFTHRGSIEVNVKEVLSAEQVLKLSAEELHDAVCCSLDYNDYEWNKARKISFKHKKQAENIHNVLHKCPSCEADKAMDSKNNKLYCRHCGNTVLVDEFMLFNPENEGSVMFEDASKWLQWQREKARDQILDPNFTIKTKVINVKIADGLTGPFEGTGQGELLINKDGLYFKGTFNSEPKEMFFPLQILASISSEFGDHFEITDGKSTYTFVLKDGQDVILIELAVKELIKEEDVSK